MGALGAGAFFGVVKPQQEASAEETRRAESARGTRTSGGWRRARGGRRATEGHGGGRRAAAAGGGALLARQEADRLAALASDRGAAGASRPRVSHATPGTTANREPEIIGAIGDELPVGGVTRGRVT
ncbi:MAG: hypothetical protein IPN17_17770 [Deltaproteobacteria bacterium]|nr:hypothetical protein [Deltaproteobacteria bacterium]